MLAVNTGQALETDLFEGGQQLTGRGDFHHDCPRHHHHALGILLDLQPGLPHLITAPTSPCQQP